MLALGPMAPLVLEILPTGLKVFYRNQNHNKGLRATTYQGPPYLPHAPSCLNICFIQPEKTSDS